jgi:hypothetical protein
MCLALFGSYAAAADLEIEFTEQTLNRLLGDLGNPSAGGLSQPSGALGALGLGSCSAAGEMTCSYGTGAQGRTIKQLALSLCRGPGGQVVIVPTVEPVPWQWWITDAHFAVTAQQLTFTAKVRYRIGSKWFQVTQTVPASLAVDLPSQQLRMAVAPFRVPIRNNANGLVETLADVDVDRYASFVIPMSAQNVAAHDLAGNARTVTGRMATANVQYLPGKILVTVDGRFY